MYIYHKCARKAYIRAFTNITCAGVTPAHTFRLQNYLPTVRVAMTVFVAASIKYALVFPPSSISPTK